MLKQLTHTNQWVHDQDEALAIASRRQRICAAAWIAPRWMCPVAQIRRAARAMRWSRASWPAGWARSSA